jgi:hypothetical protein
MGFEVRSGLEFRTLRPGSGTPLLVDEVDELSPTGNTVLEWRPRPYNPFHGRLTQEGWRFGFWASDVGWFEIDAQQQTITMATGADPLRREMRMWGVPAALCAAHRGDLTMHAAAVEVAGKGVLLAGPSHSGKTTLAAAFLKAGHRFLAEDTTCCRIEGVPSLFPGPAVLRLRPDVADAFDLGNGMTAERNPDRVFLRVAETSAGNGDAVPLAAVVILRDGTGGPLLQGVSSVEALRDLWALSFRLPEDSWRKACLAQLGELVAQVPVFDLHRPKTLLALPDVVEVLADALVSGA